MLQSKFSRNILLALFCILIADLTLILSLNIFLVLVSLFLSVSNLRFYQFFIGSIFCITGILSNLGQKERLCSSSSFTFSYPSNPSSFPCLPSIIRDFLHAASGTNSVEIQKSWLGF